ncbi:MAG TPA: cytidylate kinase-like family protein [Candidatus Mediterraneibacter colneyensis]|nr:cytidylate kinase-like family protein [Candidatus Mediterraneibacter colneyensis]
MNRIITIGREFGSGGRELGRRLSEELKIAYYDQEIITEMAQKSDCVIVGRCADYILREYEPFRMFVYADMESKMARCRQKASEEEKMEDKELKQHILGIDRKRAKYYQFYTGHKWGDKLNFDLCINTSRTVIKEIVPALAKLLRETE